MTSKRTQESIAWITSSYGHAWRNSGFVEGLLRSAHSQGAIGIIESIEVGDDRLSPPIPPDRKDTDALLAEWLWSVDGPNQVDASGAKPHPWSAHLSFIPDPDLSIGRVTIKMDAGVFGNQSEVLWRAFRSVHSSENTSYACIHPWKHWITVRDRQPPLINSATFQTVLWANFIGSDLMKRFDRERLHEMNAYFKEWTADGGLFLRLSEGVLDVLAPQTKADLETQRRALAKQLKLARSY